MTAAHLTLPVTLLVLSAGVLHATWNALAKAIIDPFAAMGLIGVSTTVVAAVALPAAGLPRSDAIGYAVGSAGVHVAYNLVLMRSYRLGAFGHTYPLARGTSPLLVAAGAWLIAGERLSGVQLAGVATVAAGLMAVVFAGGRLTRRDVPATVAALATGVTIAGYTLIDGIGVRHAHNPFGYMALLFVCQGPVLVATAALARKGDRPWRDAATLRAGLGAGLLTVTAYGMVIWAQTRGPLALVSALRETSVISAAIIAAVVFHERFGWRRVPAGVAVVAGIILINL